MASMIMAFSFSSLSETMGELVPSYRFVAYLIRLPVEGGFMLLPAWSHTNSLNPSLAILTQGIGALNAIIR